MDEPITDDAAAAEMLRFRERFDEEDSQKHADVLLIDIIQQHGYNKTADAYEKLTRWYS